MSGLVAERETNESHKTFVRLVKGATSTRSYLGGHVFVDRYALEDAVMGVVAEAPQVCVICAAGFCYAGSKGRARLG